MHLPQYTDKETGKWKAGKWNSLFKTWESTGGRAPALSGALTVSLPALPGRSATPDSRLSCNLLSRYGFPGPLKPSFGKFLCRDSNRNSLFHSSQEILGCNGQGSTERNTNDKAYHVKDFVMKYSRSYKRYTWVLKNNNNNIIQAQRVKQTKSQLTSEHFGHCPSNMPCALCGIWCLVLTHWPLHIFLF